MNDDIGHEEWDAVAVGFALSALEPSEQRAFQPHLQTCQRCQRTVAEASSIGAALGTSSPVPMPEPALRSRVLNAAFASRPPNAEPATTSLVPVLPERPIRPAQPFERPAPATLSVARERDDNVVPIRPGRARHASESRRAPRWLLSAVAAVLLVAVVGAFLSVVRDRDHYRSVADSRSRAIQSLTTGGGEIINLYKPKTNHVVATVVARKGSVSLVSSELPPNSSTTTYVLWGLSSKTAPPQAIVAFDISGRGLTVKQIASDQRGDYTKIPIFAISHENGRSPPTLPSAVLAAGGAS